MDRGKFMDIVGIHYNIIKKLFISRDVNNKTKFDEDSFNDAFIKCALHFGENIISYEDAVKYFWVVYKHTKSGNADFYKHFEEFDDSYDVEDTCETSNAKYVYDIVMTAITELYGENDMYIYSLYKYHKWSKNELIEAGFDCNDFENKIEHIHKFVKAYCKKNVKTRES